ncbi:RNA polymerase sigma-70 factor (family 1) [Pedobacter sp. CG_S7]|uniref:RNA polymerase sigma-70 factor n=1 Tax=Pedobacter sp. CG_S7 TaxID=3143930 RepID=UPI00339224DF
MNILSDQHLVDLLEIDQENAHRLIYQRYSSQLYHSAYNLLRDKQLCEDLVQDLFVDLWIRRHQVEIKTLKAYLFTAIRNRSLMKIRAKKIILDVSVIEMLASDYTSDGPLLEKELKKIINKQVKDLPPKCREIYVLSRMEQLSHKEIASVLHISTKTIEKQITIALKRLRTSIGHLLLSAIALLSIVFN